MDTTPSTQRQIVMAHMFCIFQQFCAVTVYVLGKKIMAYVNVHLFVFLRLICVIPIVIFSAVLLTRKREAFRVHWRSILLMGGSAIIGILIAQTLTFVGLSHSTPTNTSIISAPCTPLFTALLSVLRGTDKMNKAKALGFLSSVLGALLLLQVWAFEFKGKTLGNLLIVGSAMCSAVNSLLQKHILNKGYHPLVVQTYVCGMGIIGYMGAYSWLGLFESEGWEIPSSIWVYVVIVGVVASGIPWCVGIVALKHTSPMTTSVYVVVQPLIAVLVGVLIMGEAITLVQILGGGLVLLGLVFVNAQPIVQNVVNLGKRILLRKTQFVLLQTDEEKEVEMKVLENSESEATPAEVSYELGAKEETNAFVIDDEPDGADYRASDSTTTHESKDVDVVTVVSIKSDDVAIGMPISCGAEIAIAERDLRTLQPVV